MTNALAYAEMLNEYALVCRGEHIGWEGDRVLNAEAFARRVGAEFPLETQEMIDDIKNAEQAYVLATKLPPSSFARFYREALKGMREALSEARKEGRL
jgi:hypothetical protein